MLVQAPVIDRKMPHIFIAVTCPLKYKALMQCRPQIWGRWTQSSSNGDSGFSLLEVLIVLALILVLTSLYWGSTTGGRQRSQMAGCQKNLQKIFVAMEIYANEHGGKFPVVTTARTSEEALNPLVPRYTADTSIFICPGSHSLSLAGGESLLKRKISYAYYMGQAAGDSQQALISGRQVDTQPKPAGQDICSSSGKAPGNNHGKSGGNFLFCDGHVDQTLPVAPFSIILTQGVVLLNPRP